MAGSNKIQIFDANFINLLNDAAYGASAFRQSGAVSGGICPDPDFNKFGYQVSILLAALAQSLVNKNIGTDVDGSFSDASFSNLVAAFAKIMTTADMSPFARLLSPAFTGVPTAPDIGAGTSSQIMTATRLANVLAAYYTAAQVNSLITPLASQTYVVGNSVFSASSASGRIVFPNWFSNGARPIIQWIVGPYQNVGSEPFYSLNWPITFPTAIFMAMVTIDIQTNNSSDIWYETVGWNQAGVFIKGNNTGGGSSVNSRPVALGIGW